ncbi:hypothetical protein L3X39_05580 [Sabulilitoribacter multivorans]|uniref:DUF4440 domain-containing protein n=1 Tax=Flaviramulus multivorans TaxID=1304750 RepID=A0ABS9IH58_9FLAO|nr:hypothetical protein [Flaviramulus multivorans]MCF7560102.1 hypothetical protein [Flaviramulus multivorans]
MLKVIKTYKLLIICILCSFTCSNIFAQNNEIDELQDVITKLRVDTNHTFLKTLKPLQSDYSIIFLNEDYAQKAFDYSHEKWNGIDKVPDSSMKPTSDTDKANVLSATKSELSKGITNGLPEDYAILANYLNDGVTVYGLQYVNDADSNHKTRAAFFKVGDRWVIIPQVFLAFK